MASEWIKFRRSLLTDGRVRKMSAKLRTNVREVLGALVIFWCLADEHADENGELFGWSFDEMDGLVGLKGFCDALPESWLDKSGEWVKCPEYLEHNGSSAKRRAEDSKRKRAVRNLSAKCPENVQKNRPSSSLLLSSLNKNKRKEKTGTAENAEDFIPESLRTPEFVEAFTDWKQHKRERGETYRPTGLAALLKKLDALGPAAAAAAIAHSIAANYAGIYPAPSAKPSGGGGGQTFLTAHERKLEREAALVARANELDAQKEAQRNEKKRSDRRDETSVKSMATSRTFGTPNRRGGNDLRGNRVSGSPSINRLIAEIGAKVCTDTGRDSGSGANRTAAESNKHESGTSRDASEPRAAESLGASESEDRTLTAKGK